jgi:hypothetical protein
MIYNHANALSNVLLPNVKIIWRRKKYSFALNARVLKLRFFKIVFLICSNYRLKMDPFSFSGLKKTVH